jgi:carbonic anhydrase/acetyltransferase-like protein (isoleucine patch superfamily)
MVVPARSLVAGVPGKVRRDLTSDDREEILQYARNYLDYVKIYLEESRPAQVRGFLEEMKIAK